MTPDRVNVVPSPSAAAQLAGAGRSTARPCWHVPRLKTIILHSVTNNRTLNSNLARSVGWYRWIKPNMSPTPTLVTWVEHHQVTHWPRVQQIVLSYYGSNIALHH
jgi:hypothetical protein